MKRLISIVLILMMAAGAAGCSSADDEKDKKMKDDLFSVYEELRPVFKSHSSNEEVCDYIAGVADKYEIYNKKLPDGGLLLMKQADPDFEDTPTTTLQCTISTENRHEDAQAAAIALTVLKNAKEHGQITVLFTGKNNGDSYGAKSLSKTYLKTDNFINLRYDPQAKLITGSACEEEYSLLSAVEKEETGTSKAYEISLVSRDGRVAPSDREEYPNPIMILGLLLSDCRNGGINLQIASFDGEISLGKYPIYAKAVVVIQPDDEQRLLTKIESSIDEFSNNYNEIEPQIIYSLKAVDTPESMLSHDSTARLLSLIYTIDDSISAKKKEEKKEDALTSSAVEKISVSDNVEVTILGSSLSMENQQDIHTSYESIAKLNGYSFSALSRSSLWESQGENFLAESLTIAAGQSDLKLKSASSLESNECAVFTAKKEDLNAVSFGVNIQQGFEISKSLILFLESLHQSKF